MDDNPRYKGFIGDKMPCDGRDWVEVVWRMPRQGIKKTLTLAGEFCWERIENENIICFKVIAD